MNVAPEPPRWACCWRAARKPHGCAPALLPLALGVAAAIALSAGWLGWLAGAELAIDDATPRILLNGLVGAVGGIAGWLAVQRIMHQSTTITALAAGLVAGSCRSPPGAPLFTPVSAAAAGVLSGAAACYFTLRTGRIDATATVVHRRLAPRGRRPGRDPPRTSRDRHGLPFSRARSCSFRNRLPSAVSW